MHYNPFKNGDPTELKDQFIGSQIWSEQYYKVIGESVLQDIFNAFADQGIIPTFSLLETVFTNPKALGFVNFKNKNIQEHFNYYCEHFNKNREKFSGLAANIHAVSSSYFGHLFEEREPSIDFMEAYRNNKIIYIKLPTNRYHETAQRIGRLVLYDLMALCSKIQTDYDDEVLKYFPLIIDEAGPFMCRAFEELLMKARDAGMGITYLHHSDGDLEAVSPSFKVSIAQNTNTNIVLGLNDGRSINDLCASIGTEQSVKYTDEMIRTPYGLSYRTGRSSIRDVDIFKVDPNEIRNLQPGEAIVRIKKGQHLHRVKLDFINPDVSNIYIEKEPPVIEATAQSKSQDEDKREFVARKGYGTKIVSQSD